MAIFNWNLVYINDVDQQVKQKCFNDYFSAKAYAEQEEHITPVALYNPTMVSQEALSLIQHSCRSAVPVLSR